MKKIKLLLGLLLMVLCFQAPMMSEKAQAAETTVKTGLVKKKGKYYYYDSEGKKLKNAWKKVKDKETGKTYKYYFGKNGAAYAGKVYYPGTDYEMEAISVKKIGKSKYGFDSDGHMLKGTYLSYDSKTMEYKLYVFKSNGKLDSAKTKKVQKASEYQDKWSKLRKLLGKPSKTEKVEGGCYGDGQEYLYYYKNFYVNTFKPADGGAEIVLSVVQVVK